MYGQELSRPRRSLDDLWNETMGGEEVSDTRPVKPRRSLDTLWKETIETPEGPEVPQWATAPPVEKPAGRPVNSPPLPDSEKRFKQAAGLVREIEGRKARAVQLFEEASKTPDDQAQSTYNANGSALPLLGASNQPMRRRDTLRAKAEGELETANQLGEQAKKAYSDLIEVGYGTDADPKSNRRWVYAKSKHPNVEYYRRPSLPERAAASTREDIDQTVRQQRDLEAQRKDYNESGWLGKRLQEISTDYLSRRPDLTPAEQDELAIRRKAMGIDAPEEPGVVQDLVSRGGRALLSTIPSAASGVAELADSAYRRANAITGGRLPESADWAPVVEPWAREVANTIAPVLPTDPKRDQDFKSKVASGIGSALGFGTVSAAANAVRIPSQIGIGVAGAGLGVDEIVQEARAAGFDPSKDPARWDKMVALAGASGMTEIFGFGKTLERWGLKRPFVKRALEVLEEGGQEALQQYLGNVNAAYVGQYDKNRPQTQDILENAVIGGIIGGGSQVADIATEKLDQVRGARAVARESSAPMNLTPSVAPGTVTNRVTVPPSFVQKINQQQQLPQQPSAEQGAVPLVEPLPRAVAPQVPSSSAVSIPVQPSALFPEAQSIEAPAVNLSTLSPQERVSAMLEQLRQKQAGRQAATLEQGLNKEFAESSGMISAAAQNWDTDRPTAELMATTGAQRLKAALNNLQKSEAYQTELGAVASRAGQPGPYIAAAQSIQQQLDQANSLFNLDAERERQQAELDTQAAKEQKRAEKEKGKQERFAQKEQQKLDRNLLIEQKRADTQAKRDESAAKRMQASEASKQKRRAELEAIRQKARDEKSQQIAQRELDRIALHDAALQAADAAGRRHQEHINQGQIQESINELIVQQNQLRDAVRYLPRTPEAQRIKADLSRYQGQIGNRIGDLRKQASGRNVPVTQAIPPLLRPDAVVNPAGGVPAIKSFYEPGAVFDRLNPTLGDAEQDTTPLLTTIRRLGGIRGDAITPGELRRLGVKESGTTGLVNNRGGLAPDRMREALVEEGLLAEDSTVDDLYQAVEGAMRAGRKSKPSGSIAEFYDQWEEGQRDSAKPSQNIPEKIPSFSAKPSQNISSDESPTTRFADDLDPEDAAALDRVLKRARQDNPRPYGDNTRPGAGAPNGVSLSPFADLEARNREQNQALYDHEPTSETFKDAVEWITEDAAKAGIEQRHVDAMVAYALNYHSEKAFWESQGLSLETVQQAVESVETKREQVREVAKQLPALQRTEIEREIAALDALFADNDAVNLLERAVQGEDNAIDEFKTVADEYGISEEAVAELIRTRQRTEAASRRTAPQRARSDSPESTPPYRAEPSRSGRRPTGRELQLLEVRPSDVLDRDFDDYMTAVETLYQRAVQGEVDIDPLTIYDSARWVGVAADDIDALRESGENAGPLARIRGNRHKRVEENRLPARLNVEIINKYKAADLDQLAIPARDNRKSRLEQVIQATSVTLEKNPSGASPAWMKEVRDLHERALAARERYQSGETKPAEDTAKAHPRIINHPDPAINGQPVLAETQDGRVIVANPGNQSGISVVKDRAGEAAPAPRSNRGRLAFAVADHLFTGKRFASIVEARKFIAGQTGEQVKPGTLEAKQVDEAIEAGAAIAARRIVEQGRSPKETYQALLELQNRLPNLNARTSTSVLQQAYSTPLPLAFVASQLAGIDQQTTVYEPSAGHSALLIAAKPQHIIANELNPERAAAVRDILPNAEVTERNAAEWSPGQKVDRVIANPPFGPVKDADGNTRRFEITKQYSTTEIDHAIAFKALDALKDDGRAVLIVGGLRSEIESARSNAYNTGAKRNFYFTLYNQYNVTDHFTVSGDLYAKQGAGWPVDVVVIDGRGKSQRDLPAVAVPQIIRSWDELGAKLNDRDRSQNAETESAAGNVRLGEPGLPTGQRDSGSDEYANRDERISGVSQRANQANDRGRTASPDGTGLFGGSPADGGTFERASESSRGDGRDSQRGDLQQRTASRPTEQSGSLSGQNDDQQRLNASKAARTGNQPGAVDQRTDRGVGRTSFVAQSKTYNSHGWMVDARTEDGGETAVLTAYYGQTGREQKLTFTPSNYQGTVESGKSLLDGLKLQNKYSKDARQRLASAVADAVYSLNQEIAQKRTGEQEAVPAQEQLTDVGSLFDEEFDKLFGTSEAPQSSKLNKTPENVRDSKNAQEYTQKDFDADVKALNDEVREYKRVTSALTPELRKQFDQTIGRYVDTYKVKDVHAQFDRLMDNEKALAGIAEYLKEKRPDLAETVDKVYGALTAEVPMDDFSPARAVLLVADSVDDLRKQDVYRLLDETAEDNRRPLANYVIQHRLDLATETRTVMAELGDESYEQPDKTQPKQPRTTKEAAKSAAKESKDTLKEIAKGLSDLFGGPKLSSGLTFDEKTYAAAKPHFEAAVQHFQQATRDVREVMANLLKELNQRFGFTPDVLQKMKPYIVRFVEEQAAQSSAQSAVSVGDYVTFSEPVVAYEKGQPFTTTKKVRGRVVGFKEDGRLDLKRADGGYATKTLSEVSVESKPEAAPTVKDPLTVAQTATQTPATTTSEADAGASDTHRAYKPTSKSYSVGTLVPVNMADAVENSLRRVREEVGDLDDYIADRLGYQSGELSKYFSGEQVDALALAIRNIEKGGALILGDQTGIGKGRVVAGVIRYAIKKGLTPVFVTEKPTLYGDMIRDLADIGSADVKPLVTNAGESVPLDDEALEWYGEAEKAKLAGRAAPPKRGKFLQTKAGESHNAMLKQFADTGKLGEYKAIFTTYNQMQSVQGKTSARHDLLRRMANNGIVIFDESHNAGGGGKIETDEKGTPKFDRAMFARELARNAKGLLYSSATFAKRPEVMDLYFRTELGKAVGDLAELAEITQKGGVPMQQVIASMLAESGQYIRRERSFKGVEYAPTPVKVERKTAENVSRAMREVAAFDLVKQEAVKTLSERVKAEAKRITGDGTVGQAGVSSVNFTSLMHNLIDQSLLALKADQAADMAIAALERGEKPVVTVANTMGSFIQRFAEENELQPGAPLSLSFNDLLSRYLERSREVIVGKPYGEKFRHYLSDEEMGEAGVQAYKAAKKFLESIDLDMPISPIDWLHKRLRDAGYRTGEITGRGHVVNYTNNGPVYATRPASETSTAAKKRTIAAFNDGTMDVIILNQSGSTGISLHASEKFKDQRRRHMIIAQAEKNIDTHMQMLGRVHRTGQVIAPRYTQMVADIPAELRPAAVLAKKMASLNANTTASRSSAVTAKDVPDFMNKYGDEVAASLMENNPDLHALLGRPLKDSERKEGLEREDAMRKVTGRIPLLKISQQEEVYDQLISEYADTLQQAEAMGENALEAKTLDLQAETTKTQPLVAGSGQSLFEQAANLEKVKSNRQGKPFKSEEVLEKLQAFLGSDARNLIALGQAGREQVRATRKDLEAEVAAYKNKVEEEHGGTKRAAVDQLAADKWFQRWQQLTGTVYPGATVQIAGGYGVVLNVERKGRTANPVALSGWRVTVAMSDARRQLSFPMSKLDFNESEGGGSRVVVRPGTTASVYDSEVGDFVDTPILNAFDKGLSSTKETRHIVTGNLIAGFSAAPDGQIVNFTDNDGRVRQGILMPTRFDPADVIGKQKEKLKTVDAVMGALTDARGEVTDREGNLTIRRAIGGGGYVFTVPSAKGRGGKYYLNRALLTAAGKDFAKRGGLMEVQVGESAARRMIEALQKGEGLPTGVGLQAKVTESKIREQKTETPTAATILADAQIQFKSGKRGQPGTLYANNAALDVLRAAYEQSHGEQRHFANVNMNRPVAERIAGALFAESQDPEHALATQRRLREIAREFKLAAQSGNTVSIVETGNGRTFSGIKTSRRHELFHDAQEGLENSRGFLAKHKYARSLIDELAARGYAPEDRTVEAAAFIASGQAGDFGLTEAQGNEFLEDYFDDIVKTNGAAALKRFFSVAPHAVKTLKQARQKYGIEVQGTTRTDRAGTRREGEDGRPRTDGRLARQSEGLLRPSRPGEIREQRGSRFSFGELENEPSGTVLGSGLDGFQNFQRGSQPKSSPYREIMEEHKPLIADPYKLQDHTIEELLSRGAAGTLPGARALHWASKLKMRPIADKLANRQANFITKTIEETNSMIAASEAMQAAEPGSRDYKTAKQKFDNARLKIADALAKAGDYTTPIGYTAKGYKSSLLSAPHIHLFNMLEQVFKAPLHEAQRAADFMVPSRVLNKYGILHTKAITDFRDLIPAIEAELRGLGAGLKEVPRDVLDMFRYGVTRQMHQADDAESGHTGGTDKFELGHRAKMIPGLDQVLNFIGRSHGAADIAFSNMVNATAIHAQANAIARKIGKETGLSKKEMSDLARDLAYRPSALMITLANDAALRFKLDYPTLAYDALQKLRDLPGSALGGTTEKGAGKALDATWKAAMDFVVPFSKIPLAAVDTYLFRYSPVAFGRVAGRMAMAKDGKYTGRYKGSFAKERFGEDTAELLRQGLVGSLSWALLGALGSFGYLSFTGGSEDDKDRRNVGNVREALRVGYGPEVRAGNYAFNLNRMGPLGQAAGIAARVYTAQQPRTNPKTGEPEEASKRIARTANAAKEGLIFNNPLGQAAKDIAGDDMHSTSAGQYVAGKLRGFVPGLARDIAKIQSPTKRQPEESSTLGRLKGDLQSGMPVDVGFGSRAQMTERLDALGHPIEEPNPFTFWREIPRNPQLEEMERLNTGFSKPKRESGETATEYNQKIAGPNGTARKLQAALQRIAEDARWANRSDEAKARIYNSELSAAGVKRADKISEGSFEAEREIEALRADAYEALRKLPRYQQMKDSEKESARDRIDEQLKQFRARAESTRHNKKTGRVSIVREKTAQWPDYDPLALARSAVLNAQQ